MKAGKWMFPFALIILMASCGKDDKQVSNEEILTQKIKDIIPQKYLDTLKKLGLNINFGTQPPQIGGAYAIQYHTLDTSNFNDNFKPGHHFSDAIVRFYDQSSSDYGIKLIGANFLRERDTSIATAISGQGNNFTVYGKVKSTVSSGKYAIVAIIISGTKDGDNIRNFRMGLINIDNSQGGSGNFIDEGQGRVTFDSDLISEIVPGYMRTMPPATNSKTAARRQPTAAPGS